jgi:hypothetical protein
MISDEELAERGAEAIRDIEAADARMHRAAAALGNGGRESDYNTARLAAKAARREAAPLAAEMERRTGRRRPRT